MNLKLFTCVCAIGLLLSGGAFMFFSGTEIEGISAMGLMFMMLFILGLGCGALWGLLARRQLTWIILIIALAGVTWLIFLFSPGGTRIISKVVAPDGTKMCLVQSYTGYFGEPYRVSFYYQKPGHLWGWFYYEHEDTRWWTGRIELAADGKRAMIRRFFTPVAYFDIPNESFTIVRWNRTLSPAQAWMPENWTPEEEISQI